MASANPPVRSVPCPGCGAQYSFPGTMAGRRGRCVKCGTTFAVPPVIAAAMIAIPSSIGGEEAPAAPPQYIAVECRVCQTRMYGRPDQIGQKVKCPDCGARTVVPPPPKPIPKNIPAAMEGEQYELWDADQQPLPSQLIAVQPKYVAVKCRQCDTLMYAAENQVGQTIACPDCGTKQKVPPAAKPVPKRSVLATDRETPVLDLTADLSERPPIALPPTQKMVFEEQRETEYEQAMAKARRTGKPLEIDARGRPVMPRWPLITGVLPFLFSPGVPARWLAFSAGFVLAVSLLLNGLETATSGGMGAVAGMCLFAIGCILTLICSSVAASSLLTIVTESSEGNKQIQNWPFIFDWFADLFFVSVALMVSALPVGVAAQFFSPDPILGALSIAAGMLLCFPVNLLSQLDIGSPWGVLSPRLLQSMLRCPFSWLTFYIESALLLAISLAAAHFGTLMVLIAVSVAAALLYARLLGRLGWRLAEAMPDNEIT